MSASLNSTVFWIISLFNIIIDHVKDATSAVKVENSPSKLLIISIVFKNLLLINLNLIISFITHCGGYDSKKKASSVLFEKK